MKRLLYTCVFVCAALTLAGCVAGVPADVSVAWSTTTVIFMLALATMIAEWFIPSHGGLGAVSIGLFMWAAIRYWTYRDVFPEIATAPILGLFAILIGISIWMTVLGLKAQELKPTTGAESLTGRLARAASDISPQGKIFLDGSYWNAWSKTPITANDTVRILSMDQLLFEVEPVDLTEFIDKNATA